MLLFGWGLIPTVCVHRGNTTYYAQKTTLGKFTVCDPKVYFLVIWDCCRSQQLDFKKKKKGAQDLTTYTVHSFI